MIKADPNLDVPPASRRTVGTGVLVMRTCEHARVPEPRWISARECEPLSPSMRQARKRRKKLGGHQTAGGRSPVSGTAPACVGLP
jgi:hypothetical protein